MNKNTEINWITRSGPIQSNQYKEKAAKALLRWVTKEVTRAKEGGIKWNLNSYYNSYSITGTESERKNGHES